MPSPCEGLVAHLGLVGGTGRSRKVDTRLPGTGNSNSHGARPVHRIFSMIEWIRTSRLSISLYRAQDPCASRRSKEARAS